LWCNFVIEQDYKSDEGWWHMWKKFQKSVHVQLPRGFAFSVLAFSLSFNCITSCIQYHPPAVQVPQVEEWKTEAAQTGEALPDKYNRYTVKWWLIFDDPVLNELEEAALKNSPTIQKAIAVLQEQRAIYRFVRADQFPQLSLFALADRRHLSNAVTSNAQNAASNSAATPTSSTVAPSSNVANPATTPTIGGGPTALTPTTGPGMATTPGAKRNVSFLQITPEITYEVDLWGKYWGRSEATYMQAKASEEDLRTAYLILTTNVAQNYFELKALDEEINLYQKTIASYEFALNLNVSRFSGGIASAQDPLQAEVTLRTTQASLEQIIRSKEASENALATAIGVPASLFELNSQGFIPKFPVIPAGLPMEILKNRPDVRSAEDLVEANRLFVGVAKTAFYPDISLTGTAGYESNKLSNLFEWKNHVLSITGQCLLPIFDGGRNSAELKRTKAVYKESVNDFLNTILTAFEQAENAIFTVSSADREIERREVEMISAEDLLEITQLNYLNGLTDYLNVIDAEQSALQAQRDYIDATRERAIATVSLIKSLGGTW
jgi:outer membrane protein, multidrug efflux system